ncbi:MAG: hypothetical protein ABIH42_10625 [Planctomycetota bacterium]
MKDKWEKIIKILSVVSIVIYFILMWIGGSFLDSGFFEPTLKAVTLSGMLISTVIVIASCIIAISKFGKKQ